MDLINFQTGKPETMDGPAAAAALAAGTHVPAGGSALVSPTGDLEVVPHDQLQTALSKGGYQVPTQDELTEFAKQAKYGEGTANELKAFGAGAARVATFGLSDAILPAIGVTTKEALREREARNPASSIAGELAGMGASAALLPGGGAVGAVGKAGEAVAEGLAPAAAGEGASLASRILAGAGQVGAKALGSAVEGAAFGAGQSVSEAALGDPDLTAQKVLGNIGMGALWGGALGGLMKTGELTVPPAIGKARDAAAGAWRTLFGGEIPTAEPMVADLPTPPGSEPAASALAATGTDGMSDQPAGDAAPPEEPPLGPTDRRAAPRALAGDAAEQLPPDGQIPMAPGAAPAPGWQDGIIPKIYAQAKQALGGPSAEETLEAFQNRAGPAEGEVLSQQQRTDFVRSTVKSLQDVYDSAEQAGKEAATFARPQETAKLLEGADPAIAQTEAQRMAQRLDQVASQMEARPSLYPAHFPAQLQDIAADFQTDLFNAETPADHYAAIRQAEKALDPLSKWEGKPSPAEKPALLAIRGLRGEFRQSLENPDLWGQAAGRQSAFNRATTDQITAAKHMRREFMKTSIERGREVWKVDARKVNTFFNEINDARGDVRAQTIDEFLRISHDLASQMELTHQVAQIRDFDPDAFRTKLGAGAAAIDRARNIVAAQPGMGFGGLSNLVTLAGAGFFGGPVAASAVALKMAAKAVTDPQQLAALERAAGKTTNAVAKGAKAVFRPVEKAAPKGAGILKDSLTPEAKLERFEKRTDEIKNRSGNSEAMIDELDEATRPTFDVAPKITQSLQQTAIRGTMFLASKLPPAPAQLPLDRAHSPSGSEIARFDRYYDAVHNPLTVLDQLKAGRVSPEALEAVAAVHPHLLQEMRTEVMGELANHMGGDKLKLSYQRKLALQSFLGQPLMASTSPQMTMSNQAALQPQQQQAPQAHGAVRPSQTGLGKLDLADRMKTSQQDAAQRGRA